MSVENNSVRSIDGLNTLFCDTINVVESIEIDGDNGNNNQLLSSNGTKTLWSDLTDLLNNLTVSAPLSFVSGTFYDGGVARAIQIADDAIANAKLANSTISGKELGTNLDNLTISAPLALSSGTTYNGAAAKTLSLSTADLTINAPLTLNSGTTYNGITAKTLDISNIANSDLSNSTISGISLGGSLATLNFDAPLSNFDYNGGTARTITIADDAIGNVKLDNSTISGKELGTNLADLELYYGLEFLSGATYNGGTARTINTKFKSGGNIDADANGLFITNQIVTIGATGVALGATATNIDMSGGDIEDAVVIGSDLIDEDNVFLPANVYYIGSGIYHMPFNAGIFHPNDDHGTANYAISDSGAKINGRGIIMSTSLELCGFADIPRGWSATGSMIDVRDSGGNVLSSSIPSYNIEKVFTYRIEGGSPAKIPDAVPLYTGSGVSVGAEHAFSGDVSVAAAVAETLLIVVNMTSSTHFIGGGYITITPP